MSGKTIIQFGTLALCAFWAATSIRAENTPPPSALHSKTALGRALFFDVNLSKNRTQSCASCHDPAAGFVDQRETPAGKAYSLGDDGQSLGDRNAPTTAYAMFIPPFHLDKNGEYKGGLFIDGRATDLSAQAGGPPTNPLEMGLPDKAFAVQRLTENAAYVSAFKALFGETIFTNTDRAYKAMTNAIAAFEKTPYFAPFDSKYDRSLRGEVKLSDKEKYGRQLFFSPKRTNCSLCHQLHRSANTPKETFSNYGYDNIGVPENTKGRAQNGVKIGTTDTGLFGNKAVNDPQHKGKFRVPTLRNVAVTGPYMHNGVFKKLRTVVLFYNKYNSSSPRSQINPETGQKFRRPEVGSTLSKKELTHGSALKETEIDALIAFLKTLTDQRYEPLLKRDGAS